MRELLERLCALNAVSSWEDEVRAFLLAEVEPHADRLRVDALGNLIAWKKGRKNTGSKLLLTAHMDEVGLMIRQVTDDGYLKFDTVGAIDRRVLLGKPVLVGPKRVPGVVGLKAYHLVSREEEKSVPKLDEFYIDIGAKDRAGAEAQVALGDTAAFDSDAGDFGAGLFHGKALGSRLGCAVLLTLLRDELPMDCTFVFTAQKEVGARGAFGAAFSVTPEVALVVDGALPERYDTDVSGKNPRTAIGQRADGSYVAVAVDGRLPGYSEGMTIEELAQYMLNLGCVTAYNLDGGMTSCMYFNGNVISTPCGTANQERSVSDILFVAPAE